MSEDTLVRTEIDFVSDGDDIVQAKTNKKN